MLQHKRSISWIILKDWNISRVSIDAKPDRGVVSLMKSILFPGTVGRAQDLLQRRRNPDIDFFVRKAIYCKLAWEMGCLSAPATVAEMRITLVAEKCLFSTVGTLVALAFVNIMAVKTIIEWHVWALIIDSD